MRATVDIMRVGCCCCCCGGGGGGIGVGCVVMNTKGLNNSLLHKFMNMLIRRRPVFLQRGNIWIVCINAAAYTGHALDVGIIIATISVVVIVASLPMLLLMQWLSRLWLLVSQLL